MLPLWSKNELLACLLACSAYRASVGFFLRVNSHVSDQLVLGVERFQLARTVLQRSKQSVEI